MQTSAITLSVPSSHLFYATSASVTLRRFPAYSDGIDMRAVHFQFLLLYNNGYNRVTSFELLKLQHPNILFIFVHCKLFILHLFN